MIASAAVLSACGNTGNIGLPGLTSEDTSGPVQLNASRQDLGAGANTILMPLQLAAAKRAIENYRINKRGKPSPYIYKGVDLSGDGRPEILAYFSGESWCAKTGCTLAVLTPVALGYKQVTTIRRVKPPIAISEERVNGWRTLIVNTGGAGGMPVQTVALKFTGRGYPGNATLLAPIPIGGAAGAETIFPADAVSASSFTR